MDTHASIAVVPTYDEAEGIADFLARFLAAAPTLDLLVVDDGSPDGTGRICDELALADRRIHVLHRAGKDGLGSAYRAGFAWALDRGYDVVVQLDADGQHPPERVPALLALLAEHDLVIASRYVDGGGTPGWAHHRRLLSRVAGVGSSTYLELPYRDLSGGFKAWRAEALRTIEVESTTAAGFAFQIETTLRAHRAGLRVVETPFLFGARTTGRSKLDPAVAIEGARLLHDLRHDGWRVA